MAGENKKAPTNELDLITEKIIGSAFAVSNALGMGFLEKVYENAMMIELKQRGLTVSQQNSYKVYYKETAIGNYLADMVVENNVVVEIKAVNAIDKSHLAQCPNYLKASDLKLALIINFGQAKVQIQRVVRGL